MRPKVTSRPEWASRVWPEVRVEWTCPASWPPPTPSGCPYRYGSRQNHPSVVIGQAVGYCFARESGESASAQSHAASCARPRCGPRQDGRVRIRCRGHFSRAAEPLSKLPAYERLRRDNRSGTGVMSLNCRYEAGTIICGPARDACRSERWHSTRSPRAAQIIGGARKTVAVWQTADTMGIFQALPHLWSGWQTVCWDDPFEEHVKQCRIRKRVW